MDDTGRPRYGLVGRCQEVTGPMAALIGMPGWVAAAEPETYRVVPSALHSPGLEPWSQDFQVPVPGQMVEAEGRLGVVADHEWDFAIPDARMNWRLDGIRLLEHRTVAVPGEPGANFTFGPVVNVATPHRLSRTADRLGNERYLVDLAPVTQA